MTMRLRLPLASALLVAVALCAAVPAFAQQAYEDLILAVVNDRAAEVRSFLARGADPDSVDPSGEPLVVIAARNGNAATIDVLLAARAKPDMANAHGDTALMIAALKGNLEIARKLKGAGARLDPPGWTPLIYAATGGHAALVNYFLDQGANINATSPNGTTALMMAIREHHPDIADLLLNRGADASRRNDAGMTALSYAEQGNEKALAQRLRGAAR